MATLYHPPAPRFRRRRQALSNETWALTGAKIQRFISLKCGVWDHRKMIVTLQTQRDRTLEQVSALVDGSEAMC